jgi:hypothetical protein
MNDEVVYELARTKKFSTDTPTILCDLKELTTGLNSKTYPLLIAQQMLADAVLMEEARLASLADPSTSTDNRDQLRNPEYFFPDLWEKYKDTQIYIDNYTTTPCFSVMRSLSKDGGDDVRTNLFAFLRDFVPKLQGQDNKNIELRILNHGIIQWTQEEYEAMTTRPLVETLPNGEPVCVPSDCLQLIHGEMYLNHLLNYGVHALIKKTAPLLRPRGEPFGVTHLLRYDVVVVGLLKAQMVLLRRIVERWFQGLVFGQAAHNYGPKIFLDYKWALPIGKEEAII